VIFSIHWGGNWGYEIPPAQREFAHRLIDAGGADIIHGHSSHHPKAVEVYSNRLILYGCGDFLNDYEGISGYEEYRSNLVLMYFVTLGVGSRELLRLVMAPLEIRRFRLQRPCHSDLEWLRETLDHQAKTMGSRVEPAAGDTFELHWG
jgi:poly-gamma-glutamate synthesis protein (capsule biosynthesis protein)